MKKALVPGGFEKIVIDQVKGFTYGEYKGRPPRAAMISLEDGDGVFRIDGGDLQGEGGHMLMATDLRIIIGLTALNNFRVDLVAGEPVLQVTYFY